VPPRLRPGRKPSTDTPSTKRKAQNRAAQRAFRERRAARVGELEEQLEETKEEQQKREAGMRSKIVRLEADVLRFNGELQSWRMRCDTLDQIAEYERREKEAALAELSYIRNGARMTGTDAVPLPPRRVAQRQLRRPPTPQYTKDSPAAESGEHLGCDNCTSTSACRCVEQAMTTSMSKCGNCTVDSHCECLEETIRAASSMPITVDLKRSHSPPIEEHADKRPRALNHTTALEVDFTARFSSKPHQPAPATYAPVSARPPAESCGFCEEGTYCVCAEAAAAAADPEQENQIQLAPLLNEATPPPSDTDVDGIRKLRAMHPNKMHRSVAAGGPANSCINGPGTCQQCQSDPKSGLFCRSLAAMRASAGPTSSVPDGCCGGNTGGGACCKTLPSRPTQAPPSLSCADTYKTLSTHKNFDQASDELNSWLGRLNPATPQQAARAPIEVEAASVMGVLKMFDRRFGRG
jgi:hypothetical protein